MENTLNQQVKYEIKPRIFMIEPELIVGNGEKKPMLAEVEYRELMKHYQKMMLDRYHEDIKKAFY